MTAPFRFLIVDDSEKDTLLIVRALRMEWPALAFERVDGATDLRQALKEQTWDCVLCDMVMPGFGPSAALEILKENEFYLPFLVVSGVVDIEDAVSLMKAGAHDFIRKDDLARLAPAVERAIRDFKNIRKRKDAESRLSENEAIYKTILDNMPAPIDLKTADGRYLFVNKIFAERQGMSVDEIKGRTASDLWPKEIAEHLEVEDRELLRAGSPIESEIESLGMDGELRYYRGVKFPVFTADGDIAAIGSVHTDVTERKQAEEFQRRLLAAMDGAAEMISIYDADDRLIYGNQALRNFHHGSADYFGPDVTFEAVARGLLDTNPPLDAIGREEAWLEERLRRRQNSEEPFEMAWQDGTTFIVRDQTMPDGSTITTASDITERKAIEQQLRQAQKLEAVGQLTGGIAHDFNNILGIIMGNLQLTQLLAKDSPEIMEYTELALEGTKRGADITKKLLDFSRRTPSDTKLAVANDLVAGMEDLIAKSLTALIDVETGLAEELWPVKINPGDFQDAILNLCLNARDAMPDGGKLLIETANKVLDNNFDWFYPTARTGEFVVISVSDTGTGMTDEVKEKLFEPFFTTKEFGRGSGLGLSMVHGFVQRSGGHIQVYSELGAGTTFRIFLPRAKEEARESEAGSDHPAELPGGSETILIVEDEEVLLNVAVAYLEDLGYKTLMAINGKAALEAIKEHREIELLFCDVIMPGGLDGYEMALAAHEIRPPLKVLLTSGFTTKRGHYANGDDNYLFSLASNFLSKPYNHKELALAVRRALDGEA